MSVRFLVAGSSGQLGSAFLSRLGNEAAGFDLPQLDITDPESVMRAVRRTDPEFIINCAAVTDVDLCQRDFRLARSVHVTGVENLASAGRRLVVFSTDHVFGGDTMRREPYLETDRTSPVNRYGISKLEGEEVALTAGRDNLVIRTSWLWKHSGGLVPFLWNSLKEQGRVRAVSDQVACAAYAPDVVEAVLGILDSGGSGIFHVVNGGEHSPESLAVLMSATVLGEVIPVSWSELGLDAPRPSYSALATGREVVMPDLEDAMARWRDAVE